MNREIIRDQINTLEDVIRGEIAEQFRNSLLDQLKKLRTQYEEIVNEIDKPDDIRLAEILHKKLCHWNHTDGCSWLYEKWSDALRPQSVKKEYLDMSRKILQEFNINDAIKFVDLMK